MRNFYLALGFLLGSSFTCGEKLFGDIVHFEDKTLGANSFYNGNTGTTNSDGWVSGGAKFNNNYDTSFGGFWDGWSYSNVNNTTTAGFLNQYAAYTGTGLGGSGNYAVAFQSFPQSYIDLPSDMRAQSAWFTNTTYAALSMLNGDSFAKKFGGASGNDADFFKLTIRGYDDLATSGNLTGTKDFYLADYRFDNNALDYVVSTWQEVDLSGLGNAKSIGFSLTSSDNGGFGMNTPAFFAMDNLSLTAVPEPTSVVLVCAVMGLGVSIRFRRRG